MTAPRVRVLRCSYCPSVFRGVNPTPLKERHEAEHRSATVLAVSCGAT